VVASRSNWGLTPRQSIESECGRRGRAAVVDGCTRLLAGADVDERLVVALGGPHARRVLDHGPDSDQRYWLRVWAARGLLWVWDDDGLEAVRDALGDPAWRVREMAAKVVVRHLLGDLLSVVAELRADPVPRVRAVAGRAVAALTNAGA
jgi:hypothetical protein